MITKRFGRLFALLALTVLLLTACQPAALAMMNEPAEPARPSALPGESAAQAPVSETAVAGTQAVPGGEGTALPPAALQVPEGWQVLMDDMRGYSLAFPPAWNACQETRYSWTFCDRQEDPAWMGAPLRLYVSVFPKDSTNSDWEVYNFIPTRTLQEYRMLPVGEAKPKEPGSPRPEYISYTRLPDRMVAGSAAPVIENSRLWGIPPGTKERVVFLVTGDTTYILGMYYETPEQLALFEQVLGSFQFSP